VDLRVVWKNNPLPFHRGAMPAAKAALAAAEQGKFWEMHDRLLADQQHLDEPTFVKYAQELGLDRKRFASAMTAKHVEAAIRDDVELAGSVGARATPSFFINGQPLLGEPTAKNLEMAVEATLRASRAASETRAALGTAAQASAETQLEK
jgi:protein-disulfide isomerase